jgi:hypothetical protein
LKRGLKVRKSVKQVAIIAALSVAATIGISSPAWADGVTRYQSRRTDACLDSNTAGNAYTLGCNTGAYQYWTYQSIDGTSYYLINKATGRCLDANSAGSVYTLSCNGGANQQWRRRYPGSAAVYGQWVNIAVAKCLTASVYAPEKHAVFLSVCTDTDQTVLWAKV